MATSPSPPRLITGQRMEREEFIRVWDQIPELKNAELIDGEVWVASPIGCEHSECAGPVHLWLGYYAAHTPGTQFAPNASWLMLSSMPQPDAALRILSEYGGQSGKGKFFTGAPELAVEICQTSTTYDFGPKLALYQRAGVLEYITVEVIFKRITWRVLEDGSYREIAPASDGILRSLTFPGLWLNVEAFRQQDQQTILDTLNQGLRIHAIITTRLDAQLKQ